MPIIAIAMGGILFSCVDSGKDLYDPPTKRPTQWETVLLLLMV